MTEQLEKNYSGSSKVLAAGGDEISMLVVLQWRKKKYSIKTCVEEMVAEKEGIWIAVPRWR